MNWNFIIFFIMRLKCRFQKGKAIFFQVSICAYDFMFSLMFDAGISSSLRPEPGRSTLNFSSPTPEPVRITRRSSTPTPEPGRSTLPSPSPKPEPSWPTFHSTTPYSTDKTTDYMYYNDNNAAVGDSAGDVVVHHSVSHSSATPTLLIICILAAVVIIVIVVAIAAVCIIKNRQPPTANISLQVTNATQSQPLQASNISQPPPLRVPDTTRPPPFAPNTDTLPGHEETATLAPLPPGPPVMPSAPPEEEVSSRWQLRIELLSSQHPIDQRKCSSKNLPFEIILQSLWCWPLLPDFHHQLPSSL